MPRSPILSGPGGGMTIGKKHPEEDHVDYRAVEEDGDDEEGSSEDNEGDDIDMETDEDEEEKEHSAPADSIVVALPATDHAPSAEEIKPFETDDMGMQRLPRLLAISTPPSSPLSLWSSPLPQIPSPSLPLSPPSPVLSAAPPPSPIHLLGYRAAMIRMRAEAAFTSHSLPLPPSFILSPARSDAPSLGIPPPLPIPVRYPPWSGYEVGESSYAVAAARPAGGLRADYGFVAIIDREIRRDPEREVGYGITDSWDEIVETLQGHQDRRAQAYTRHQMGGQRTRLSLEAWSRSMDASELAPERLCHCPYQMSEGRPWEICKEEEVEDSDHTRTGQQLIQTLKLMASHYRDSDHAIGTVAALQGQDGDVFCIRQRSEENQIKFPLDSCAQKNDLTSTVQERDKKLEAELWNLKVKGTDVIGYNQRFQELALLCVRMFPEESDKIERYVGGLPDMIHGNIVASKPKTMQEAVEMATELMDKKVTHCQKTRLRTKGSLKTLPETIKTNNNRTRDRTLAGPILSAGNANNANNQRGTGSGQKPTCFECGVQGHFKRECPKLKNNKNRGNQVGNDRAPAKVYAVGHAGTNPDSNVVTGTFLLNNR
ncbi:putative reverse transcriptase domain-containing protein [Tanacetum coccineum]